jgi:hypothetical protein
VIDVTDAQTACRHLHEAAQLIREDPNRQGSLLTFGSAGQVVMTGDMHGHLRNFEKLQRFCALERRPGCSVILHELIHQEPETPDEPDLSIDLLVQAAAWKCQFPDNVFFLQSNHELAQLRGQEISKGGRSVLRYGKQAEAVLARVHDYIAALPLAARAANGVFMSHSLPDPLALDLFDHAVFEREPTAADLAPGGSAYSLVWGRFHSVDAVEYLAQRWGVEVFLIGHTPQEDGYMRVGRLFILSSDHAHGVFLPIDLARRADAEELERAIRKFVSVA